MSSRNFSPHTLTRTEKVAILWPMLTVSEVAVRLRMTPTTVYRWIDAGFFPGAKKTPTGIWRIPKDVVDEMLEPEITEEDVEGTGTVV